MELKICETHDKSPSICLNMIVKNEAHIIRETLEMLCDKIKFSYWVICDTGSSDNTKEIICNFFKEKQIEGEIFDHEWKNFAYNRTLALEMAFYKSDLLFIFDADDEIHGKIDMPLTIDGTDGYYLNFGSSQGISYQRVLLINNRIKWNYQSVIHEYINCLKPNPKIVTLTGDYYVVSGRRGSRNQDPNKYLKDAKVLEEAYYKAKSDNDNLYLRYGFYCANSYKDAGMSTESIKWYKVTLSNDNWYQEKYVSCLYLFGLYSQTNETEKALFYLVESFRYDTERMECVFHLVVHYLLSDLPFLAYRYYSLIKDFYENRYLTSDVQGKLFVEVDKPNLYLPYYMILVSDKVKKSIPEAKQTITNMYVIVFTKKFNSNDEFFIGNILYNLQFFIEECLTFNGFKELFQSYIDFLQNVVKYNLSKHDFLKIFIKYGINFECFNNKKIFTQDECIKSNKILFYTGFCNKNWNYSFYLTNALGGSETAAICLARSFPKNMEIYIVGSVQEEKIENITFVNLNNFNNLVQNTPFHTVIVSRYIAFYEMFPETSFYQSFIWGHDICLFSHGCNLNLDSILNKWNQKINKCICQTEWHKNLFAQQYPQLKDKIVTVNNGLELDKFKYTPIKVQNRFIYTSCAERGLERLLELWPSISKELPDAELFIASYNYFPQNNFEVQLNETIQKHNNIKHLGTLTKDKLYEVMSSADFWLYPTNFNETSCITSMEMLMSQVICIYYPIAGLVNTLGEYGIPIQRGDEIQTILQLTTQRKNEIRQKGKEYALSCSWENRANTWLNTLNLNNNITINEKNDKNIQRMFELYENISMPEAHHRILKNISNQFTPKVIYDIGASTLHWTKEVKKIWNNVDIIAFDAIEEAEELYKSQNIKFHIGVLSDQDNKVLKFYENKENPAGNSYYKEIGHPNSIHVYPENSYTEKKAMTLQSIVQQNNFLLPDIVKIDVQGAELDILKGGQNIINHAKYLIIELQNVEYNRGAPLENITIEYLQTNGWKIEEAKFSNNGPDADYLFINTNYTKSDNLDKDYILQIVNLKRRSDRKNSMIQKLNETGINNYKFFEAIDGNSLEPSIFIKNLFKSNDFNYRRGIIGCALSHILLWNKLVNDDNYDFYIILEDDIVLCDNFKKHLNNVCNMFIQNNLEHLAIGEYYTSKTFPNADDEIKIYKKDLYKEWNVTFGYIISKKAAIKSLRYINNCSIKNAIDNPQSFGYILEYSSLSHTLVSCSTVNEHGSDIQSNTPDSYLNIPPVNDDLKELTVSFCDWWHSEYCGGYFDPNDNFFTNLLKKYGNNYDVKIVNPSDNPDVLFYSIFGTSHKNLNAKRKIFFSGEPYSCRVDADFNITFDRNSNINTRVPLWICYFDNLILDESNKRKNNTNVIPQRDRFCSFIGSGPGLTNNRKEFIDKLSLYKKVDCGGSYLNNIGFEIPRGINGSGKIEHNSKYKFGLAFESKSYPGYVTEKICDLFKSNTLPIYWGTEDVVNDFNPKSFINANNFSNFDDLIDFIIKVDNNNDLYNSFFKEPILSNMWIDIFTDPNSTFFKNLADNIIGNNTNLLTDLLTVYDSKTKSSSCVTSYKFEYGFGSNKKDITNIILSNGKAKGFIEIPYGDDARAEIYGDPCWGIVKNIYVTNTNLIDQNKCELKLLNENIISVNEYKFFNLINENYSNKDYKFIMGFYDNSLSERGTTAAMFSYADYAEKYFKCKSIIFYNKFHNANDINVIRNFYSRFLVFGVENFYQIDEIVLKRNIKYFYNICGGTPNSTPLLKNSINLIHAVFNIEPFWSNKNEDKYSAVSDYLIQKSNHKYLEAVPHIVDLPIHNQNMRKELNISEDKIVIGRYGGFEQFDLTIAHEAIKYIINNNHNIIFLFVNTKKFYQHPQIIYLDKIIKPELKVKFINTCDSMIHARSDGETFGLAVAEFSYLNKPIITCKSNVDNCHLEILRDKAIIYDSKESLIDIFENVEKIINSRTDWNAYKDYNPENVMRKFHKVFIPKEEFINEMYIQKKIIIDEKEKYYTSSSLENLNYTIMSQDSKCAKNNLTQDITLISVFFDIGRTNWSKYSRSSEGYVNSFIEYFNYDYEMIIFIDDRYIYQLNEKISKMNNNKNKNNKTLIPINYNWLNENIYSWKQIDSVKKVMNSDFYKSILNDRIQRGCPENLYPEYNLINISKVDFICFAINNDLVRNDFICWVDFGYFSSVLNNNFDMFPVTSLDIKYFNVNKINFCLKNKLNSNDVDYMYTLLNAPENFTGGFWGGNKTNMKIFQKLVHSEINEMIKTNIFDDDQYVYLRCFLKNQDLFELYLSQDKWPDGLNYFQKTYT